MKLSEIRGAYEELSGTASKLVRNLSFTGIAIIWVFKTETEFGVQSPSFLIYAAIGCAAAIGCDLLQYIVSSLIWYRYYEVNRKADPNEDREMNEPEWYNIPSKIFFGLKLAFAFAGYCCLIKYLITIL